ncbi:hypothetical protein C5167_026592 [Papaver somniferum]|uniref:uncharacterized protein LOC113326346 n=1 Tax=Papaver somniferum TaxID=3469 RepID=UPI000E705303|nr:uncharacterized protein LOC113326346 [Papaver somniferum]RZC85916.1 hypothetical protein C5167_026592 [Papaver somniferum]
MVRRLTLDSIHHYGSCFHAANVPVVAVALFVSVTVLVALCAKHTIRRRQLAREKLGCNPNDSRATPGSSPMAASRGLFATISNKAFPFMGSKKSGDQHGDNYEAVGDGGVWQRGILMGGKCQPPDFSGVIYYDVDGRQLSEIPRSPRASPFPSSFSFPAAKDGNF